MNNASIAILDYGMGNILSVSRAFEYCGADVHLAKTASEVNCNAQGLVVPGVGAFADGMAELERRHFATTIQNWAQNKKPLLGICLGMQMIFESSLEYGSHQGLGIIPGCVVPLQPKCVPGERFKIPHTGWSSIETTSPNLWENTILHGIHVGDPFYFVHSFIAKPTNPNHILASCSYASTLFPAAVQSELLYGCQFHPEKSGPAGLKVIKNFIEIASRFAST